MNRRTDGSFSCIALDELDAPSTRNSVWRRADTAGLLRHFTFLAIAPTEAADLGVCALHRSRLELDNLYCVSPADDDGGMVPDAGRRWLVVSCQRIQIDSGGSIVT